MMKSDGQTVHIRSGTKCCTISGKPLHRNCFWRKNTFNTVSRGEVDLWMMHRRAKEEAHGQVRFVAVQRGLMCSLP